jgi:hypothetical protein
MIRKELLKKFAFYSAQKTRNLLYLIGIILFSLHYLDHTAIASHDSTATATSTPSSLSETNLNNAVIHITLGGDPKFKTGLQISLFTLNNAPQGTSISNVQRINDRTVNLTLSFNGTDFDNNITNFSIFIKKDAMDGGPDNGLATNTMTITAVVEVVSINTKPLQISENTLNGAIVLLQLINDTFTQNLSSNITLLTPPPGTSIREVARLTNNNALLTLDYNGTDFDTDQNFTIRVSGGGLNGGVAVTSSTVTAKAILEIEGQGDYQVTGSSYPTNIQIAGYNIRDNNLYINFNFKTTYSVVGTKTATFHYFIEIFDINSKVIGRNGNMTSPLSIKGPLGSQTASVDNHIVSLRAPLSPHYRVVITIVNVFINS